MWNRDNDVRGIRNRRVNDCEDVFECLLDLLQDELGENNRRNRRNDDWNDNVRGIRNRRVNDCEDVFECLEELLEDALEDNNNHCRRHCCKRH
ncbi:MAG: hypothetical protein K0R07_608 [Sedimentibacter sp.]|jgi:hypothetical protein|nr:hypothetical protein [Sedimentibacter sp.]